MQPVLPLVMLPFVTRVQPLEALPLGALPLGALPLGASPLGALPFTRDQFFAVFGAYNEATWPAPVLLVLLALAAAALLWRRARSAGPVASAVLALLWLWAGGVYHLLFFRPVNPAAAGFAALFVLAAALLLWHGVLRRHLVALAGGGWRRGLGGVLVAYALVGYPLLGLAAGHPWRQLPVLGVPCPTTILTFGLLFWMAPAPPRVRLPPAVLVIPLLWAAVGGTAAFALGVPQDLGLLLAGACGLLLLLPTTATPRPARMPARGPVQTPGQSQTNTKPVTSA